MHYGYSTHKYIKNNFYIAAHNLQKYEKIQPTVQ